MKKSKLCFKHLIPPQWVRCGLCRLLLTVCFLGMFNAMAGQGKLNQAKVSLDLKNVSLITCFNEIQKQTGIDFVYNVEQCDQFDKISLSVKESSIESVLDMIFAGKDLEYRFESGMVVVRKNQQSTLPQVKSVVITGLVTDLKGEILPGVTVSVKGTSFGTATDENGKYSLEIPDMKELVLVYSFVGMKTQEIAFKGVTTINVKMEEEINEMEGVVVTGIFNKPKESFTGAAVKVTREELQMAGNRNILQSLSNLDPSFVLVENNAQGSNPNARPEIRMRGISSIPSVDELQTSTRAELCTPLFILDGFEITIDQMMDLNNDEIESITLLKDASSTAMYGSRGANGVVVIKSVEPQAGRLKVSYSGNVNLEIPSLSSYNLLNASEKLQLEKEAGLYDKPEDLAEDARLKQLYAQKYSRVLAGVNTDWLSIPVRVGIGQNHYLNINGGDKSFRYSMGVSYNLQKGAMKGSDRSTMNGSLRLSYLTEKFSFNNNLTLGLNKANQSNYGNFSLYANMNPYYEPYDQEGHVVKQFELENTTNFPKINNPLWDAFSNSFDGSKYTSVSNNFSITYNPLKTVQAIVNFSYSKNFSSSESFVSPTSSQYFSTSDVLKRGKRNYSSSETENWAISGTVNYYNTWGKHILTAGVNYEARQSDMVGRSMSVLGFVNESMNDLSNANSYDGDRPNSSESRSRTIGIAGTVNYNYDNRYFMDFSYRADGSSSFGTNSRWAPFYSMGIGWNINRERFIMDYAGWLTLFRVKYSYGASGSLSFNPSQSLGTYNIVTNSNYHGGIIAQISGLENPDLKWQTTYQHNIGTDISLWEGWVSVSANWYRKLTKNSITDMALPLSNGFDSYTGNEGDILNTGFDINLSFYVLKNQEKGVMWNMTLGTSHNKNTLLTLSEAVKERMASGMKQTILEYVLQEGESVDAIYAVPTVGVDPATGKILYLYKDGSQSYKYDVNQRIACGDRMPKFDGRISTSFQWKSFSVYAGFTLRLGGQKYNDTYASKIENVDLHNNVDRRVFTDRWKKPGDNSPFYGLNENVSYITDRYVQDENTFACNNLNISYELPVKLVRRWGFDRLGVNASVGNLFYISTVKQERGTSYPYAIQPSFGLSCSF